MTVPADAKVFLESMDPTDIVDFQVDLNPLLEGGETISTYTVGIPTESSLLGLANKTTGGYSNILASGILTMWLEITLAEQSNSAFTGEGVILPIEITINTSTTPSRRKQRTVAVVVRQR